MPQDNGLECLDKLLADLGGADMGMQTTSPCRLLLEHLQAARRDLLGSMSGEYRASLQDAKESVGCITNKHVRTETTERLKSLLNSGV